MTNWIKELVEKAKKDRLCVRWSCSTCGSHQFKSILTKRCFQKNSLPFPSNMKPSCSYISRKPIISDLLPNYMDFVLKLLAKN